MLQTKSGIQHVVHVTLLADRVISPSPHSVTVYMLECLDCHHQIFAFQGIAHQVILYFRKPTPFERTSALVSYFAESASLCINVQASLLLLWKRNCKHLTHNILQLPLMPVMTNAA